MNKRERHHHVDRSQHKLPRAVDPTSTRALFEQVKATAYATKDYQVERDHLYEEQQHPSQAVLVPAFVYLNSQHAHAKPGGTNNVRQQILYRWHTGAMFAGL